MKRKPFTEIQSSNYNASQRIITLFLELPESQFTLDDVLPALKLRTPFDFANRL